jgi:hypothetical protein
LLHGLCIDRPGMYLLFSQRIHYEGAGTRIFVSQDIAWKTIHRFVERKPNTAC